MPTGAGAHRDVPLSQSPAEAARTLRDLDAIGGRSRRVAYAKSTRTPLVLWGAAWLIGYAALDTLPWAVAVPAGVALAVAAAAGTWLGRSEEVVSGWERRTRLSWLAVMGSSPLLVAIISPAPAHTVAIFLGALWGIALVLFAVAAGDLPLGVVGAVIVLTAAAVRVTNLGHDLLVFGVVAGIGMAGLGIRRRLGTPG